MVPVDVEDGDGNTLLMLAAYHGHAATVRLLVDRGADVDRLNHRGQAPLAGALFKGEDEVVRVLLDAGADLDAGTPSPRAPAPGPTTVAPTPQVAPSDVPTTPPPGVPGTEPSGSATAPLRPAMKSRRFIPAPDLGDGIVTA